MSEPQLLLRLRRCPVRRGRFLDACLGFAVVVVGLLGAGFVDLARESSGAELASPEARRGPAALDVLDEAGPCGLPPVDGRRPRLDTAGDDGRSLPAPADRAQPNALRIRSTASSILSRQPNAESLR